MPCLHGSPAYIFFEIVIAGGLAQMLVTILSGIGAGTFGSISEGIAAFTVEENRLLPDAEHCRRYDDLFETYRQSAGLLDALLPKRR